MQFIHGAMKRFTTDVPSLPSFLAYLREIFDFCVCDLVLPAYVLLN